MPKFLIDTCITIRARDHEAAAFHAKVLADFIRNQQDSLVAGVHICHIEECPPEGETTSLPIVGHDPGDETQAT